MVNHKKMEKGMIYHSNDAHKRYHDIAGGQVSNQCIFQVTFETREST